MCMCTKHCNVKGWLCYICAVCVRTKLCTCCLCYDRTVNVTIHDAILKSKWVPEYNKFQGRLSNWSFHPLPVHLFPEISITTVFLNGVKNLEITLYTNVYVSKEQYNKGTRSVFNKADFNQILIMYHMCCIEDSSIFFFIFYTTFVLRTATFSTC